MKKRFQLGFAAVELIIVVVVLAVAAGAGYYVWHKHNQKPAGTTAIKTDSSSSSSYQSPATTVPAAPEVNNASDLNSAMSALNQTDVSSSNTDSSQLSSETSGF